MIYVMAVNRYTGGNSGIFIGWNVTREKVGAWEHQIQADVNGHAFDEFIDHHTKFNDYNSILGRSIVLYAGNDTTGDPIGHGNIGLMEKRTTPDYPPAPVTKGKVFFTAVNRLVQTYGWLGVTSQGTGTYDLKNLQANHSYELRVYTTGDLFSAGDKNVSMASAGNMLYVLQSSVTMDTNGVQSGSFSNGKIDLNGPNSILGRVVTVADLATQKTVAVGVLGIEEDDPAFSGPTQIRCDIACPTPSPTPRTVILPPSSPPTRSFNSLGVVSASSYWCVLSLVTYAAFIGLL
eukprot:TRINITY_DN2050_c0_g1_i1.p1 TRINITY_DN2050_c0_g1~~TRINITY_DN2050_c0_g1_i1.p1  ORF type:complete len:291 (+),score=55.56 TRINITY_DN2050_c0_g1_i1:663-1535(+)